MKERGRGGGGGGGKMGRAGEQEFQLRFIFWNSLFYLMFKSCIIHPSVGLKQKP